MSKNKRMIYVADDNIEFYDQLKNKSDFINGALRTAQLGGVQDLSTTEVATHEPTQAQSTQGMSLQDELDAMRQRDLDILRKSREG